MVERVSTHACLSIAECVRSHFGKSLLQSDKRTLRPLTLRDMLLFRFTSEMLEATTEWWLAQCATLARQWFTANKHMLFLCVLKSSNSCQKQLPTHSEIQNCLIYPGHNEFNMWEDLPCMGRLPMYGKSSRTWEVFLCMGTLPIDGKSSHLREDFPMFLYM